MLSGRLRMVGCVALLLSVVTLAGCSGGGYPISVEVTVPIATGYSINGYGGANPGDILTPDTNIPSVPLCSLPSRDDVDDMVRQQVGGFVAGLLELERLELIELLIEATEGDFNTITQLSLEYEPKPILLIPQPAVDLGETASDAGLGATITLQPPDTVDFLDIIEDNESNPTPGCPSLDATMTGTVPAVTPTWNVSARLRVIGNIGI